MRSSAAALLVLLPLFAACTSTEATLDPAAITAPSAAVPATDTSIATAPSNTATLPTPPAPAASTVPGQSAAIDGPVRVQIAPIIGAPAAAADPLAARLAAVAPAKRFAVVAAADPSTTHILKGFFSTSPEAGATVVYYVWDVMDRNGNRVHRFSGQQKVTSPGNGWTAVNDATMRAIADKTADDFALWFAGRAG